MTDQTTGRSADIRPATRRISLRSPLFALAAALGFSLVVWATIGGLILA